MRALVANEPCMYREVLVDALRQLRPQLEVSTVEPDGLDAEVERLRPHLVVCSRASAATPDGALTWVVLYPDGENLVEIITASGRATIVGISFDDFLSIVDGTEFLRRSAQERRLRAWES